MPALMRKGGDSGISKLGVAIMTKRKPFIPDTTDAEKWLDADHFVYHGKVWTVNQDGTVKNNPEGLRDGDAQRDVHNK